MKKTVKYAALVCSVALLATLLGGCSAVDSGKLWAVEFLVNQGQYELAYQLLRDLDGEEAEEWKDKLVFVPLSEVEYGVDGYRSSKTTFLYDEKQYPMIEEYESETCSITTTYSYDTNGNLLTRREIRTEENETTSEMSVATYDERGNCLSEETTLSDGTVVQYTYAYDEKDNLVKMTFYHLSKDEQSEDEDDWESYSYENTMTYDEKGNLVTDYCVWVDGSWLKRTYTYTYEYDEEGHWLTCEEEEYDYKNSVNGAWTTRFTSYAATYDEKGNQLTYTEEQDGVCWEKVTCTYDDKGNQLTARTDYADGGWAQYSYSYDADGNILSSAFGNGEEDWYKSIYTYDKDGNLLTENYAEADGYWSRDTYVYDADGNCIREEQEESYGDITIKSREYDAFGNCLKAKKERNGETVSRTETQWQLVYYPNGKPETDI